MSRRRVRLTWLGEPACHDPFAVGGKAASLSRLAERFPVPPGFALTTAVFAHMPTSRESQMILPATLRAEVVDAYRLLGTRCGQDNPAVAVRSSAVDEDGTDASFAGQHETFLNVVGAEAVVGAIERCWASFTAPHAIEYRRVQGLPTDGVRVAVLVQQLVIADAAAVAFTADPLTGDRDTVLINASWGLGESIVGGTVTPDVYAVRRSGLTLARCDIEEKRRMTVAMPDGTTEVNTPDFLRRQPALDSGQATGIARLALELETQVGHPVDIECVYRGGRLYLLQCRPITTLGHGTATPVAPYAEATSAPTMSASSAAPAGERIEAPADFPVTWADPKDVGLFWTLDRVHWPEPIPPLVFAVAGDALARGMSAAARTYALPFAEVRVCHINTYRYQANVPITCAPEEAHARQARSRTALRTAMGNLRVSWQGTWLPEIQALLAEWDAFDLDGATLPQLLVHAERTLARAERLWEIHFLLATPMHDAISEFGRLHRDLSGGGMLDAYRLLRGMENRTLLGGRALWYLSRLAAARPEVQATLLAAGADTLADLERTAHGRDFLAELRSYLEEFGQRGDSLYFERPSWADDPTPVLEQIRGLMRREDRDVAGELVTTWEERDELVRSARQRLTGYPRPVREEFEFLLAAAQAAVVLTEDHNFWIDAHGIQRIRRVFLELGRRLSKSNVLAAPEDVFYLTVEELLAGGTDGNGDDLRAVVAARQAAMRRFRAVAAPAALGTRPPAMLQGRRAVSGGWPEPGVDAVAISPLRGHGASSGVAQGVARVMRSLAEAGRLGPGEVLVTTSLSSSWTPLFATAAATVTDTGGILSHAAVVAREYRIPAVLGAEGATTLIRDGELIEVDGNRGLVRVLADAEQVPRVGDNRSSRSDSGTAE